MILPVNQMKNTRQVPSKKEYCVNKNYYDIMYAYLQCESEAVENEKGDIEERRVLKKVAKFTTLANLFDLTRQTASKKFKNLMNLGLIVDRGDDYYYLTVLPNNDARILPYETLKLISDTLSEHSVNTYIYILNRYLANDCKPFTFTLSQIKTNIGICADTRSNDEIIMNILKVLKKLGLINYHLTVLNDSANTQTMKSIYQIDCVENKISC